MSDVALRINDASFTTRGYDLNRIIQQAITAYMPWNVEGGSTLRVTYLGTTTRTEPIDGEVLVLAADNSTPPGCPLAVTSYAYGGANCLKAKIEIYKGTAVGCPAQPIEWGLDFPESRYLSIASVLTHELGHALGGYSDDYSNPNTVMQSTAPGQANSSHLYNVDICLLRHDNQTCAGGDGPFAYGQRTSTFVRNRLSSDAFSWGPASAAIGTSNLRPSAATSGSTYLVAFVDATASNNPVKTRTGNGVSWNAPVTHADSRTGVSSLRAGSYFFLAYAEAADTRRLYVKRSTDGTSWNSPVLVHDDARTQSSPALAYNPASGHLLLFWSQHRQGSTPTAADTDRLRYATSTTFGTTWTTPLNVQTNSNEREFFSYQGPAASCETSPKTSEERGIRLEKPPIFQAALRSGKDRERLFE